MLERVSDPGGAPPSLMAQVLAPDEAIVAWLLGKYRPHADLASHAAAVSPAEKGKELQ